MTEVSSTAVPRPDRSRQLEQTGPAYLRIASELRQRIQQGTYAAAGPLPSQRQLSEEFSVTVMTLRQALETLKREDLLVTRKGLGTFVAPQRFSYSVGALRSLTQEMAMQGREVSTVVLRLEQVPAAPDVAAAFGVPVGTTVIALDRLRCIDGKPSIVQQSALPLAVWQALGDAEDSLAESSLYGMLALHAELRVHRATERLYPVTLDDATAALLGRAPGEPALLSERVSRTAAERTVLHDKAHIPGDRLVIAADRCADDLTMRYELLNATTSSPGRSTTEESKS